MSFIEDSALDHLRDVIDAPDLTGTRYEIERAIASGGMGTVYRAYDRQLDRLVALKVLRAPMEPDVARRMLDEARILARLEHPAIVPVHDAGTLADGRAFYAMKLVNGVRLDEYARAAHPLVDRLRVFERVCEAVAFAHAHGVIHRDLKPSNVMVGSFGEVLVMDWGAAKLVNRPEPEAARAEGDSRGARAGQTAHGSIIGTPGYMAPEQERGEIDAIDARTDVFALGALLRDLTSSADAAPPKPLVAIADRAQQPDPARRYASSADVGADVARFIAGLSVAALPEDLLDRAARFVRNYRTPLLLILAYLLMRLAVLLWGRW